MCLFVCFFQRSISENSLVAMDFSGQKSRVIENPTEALSVAVEEGLAWRVLIVSYSSKHLWFEFISSKKLRFISPFLAQRKGCLRLGTHGSPTASSQSSATNMGMCVLSHYNWVDEKANRCAFRCRGKCRPWKGDLVKQDLVFIHCISSAIHRSQPWFHHRISRDEAQRLIIQQGPVDGWVWCF